MVKVELKGLNQAIRNLRGLAKAVQKKILRKAMDKGTAPVAKMAKQLAPKGKTKLLKKSISRKVKTITRTGTVVVRVGPRRDVSKTVKGRVVRPVRYAHLVEKGTPRAAAQPFLSRAWTATVAQAEAIIADTIRTGIAEFAASVKK